MLLAVCIGNKRGAGENLYKNLLNAMPNKKEISVVTLSAHHVDEYSDEFAEKIPEEVSNARSKIAKIKAYIYLIQRINNCIKKRGIKHVLFFIENFKLCNLICFFNPNLSYSLCLHDPVLHEGESRRYKIERALSWHSYFKKINHIIVTYHGACEEMRKDYKLKTLLPQTKVIYLPQMVEQEFSDIRKKNYKLEFDYVFFGRIEPYKGLLELVAAFKDVRLSKIKLLIMGTGSIDSKVKELCKSAPNITFINRFVTDREMAEGINKSRFVILPYRAATGTQTVMVANYYNRLVIATRVGCFNEYILEGKNGFFIESCTVEGICSAVLHTKDLNINDYDYLISAEYKKYNINKIAQQYWDVVNS